jgi:hypothetical protein
MRPFRNMSEEKVPEPKTPQVTVSAASAVVDDPVPPKPHRSNEFWLALAGAVGTGVGVVATAVVGVFAAILSHDSSTTQVRAESDRAALQFVREQRKSTYLDFLNAETDLHNKAYEYAHAASDYFNGRADAKFVSDSEGAWVKAKELATRKEYAAELFASQPVYDLLIDWASYDDHVEDQILAISGQFDGDVMPSHDKIDALVEIVAPDTQPSAKHFEDVAQHDLGLSR